MGIMIAGGIDIGLTLILAVISGLGVGLIAIWDAFVIIGDILLIVGVAIEIPGLLIAWLVIGMLNIVYLFSGWIWMSMLVAYFSTSCAYYSQLEYDSSYGSYARTYLCPVIGYASTSLVFMIGLSIFCLYLWIVVMSHYKILVAKLGQSCCGGSGRSASAQPAYQQAIAIPMAAQPAYQQPTTIPMAAQPAYQQPFAGPMAAQPGYQQAIQMPMAAPPAYQQPIANPMAAQPAYQQPSPVPMAKTPPEAKPDLV